MGGYEALLPYSPQSRPILSRFFAKRLSTFRSAVERAADFLPTASESRDSTEPIFFVFSMIVKRIYIVIFFNWNREVLLF